jgi:phage protein U
MLAQLGDIVFELLKEPLKWDGEKAWRYAEHPIIWGETKLQYTGHEPRAFNLSIRFHASFCDPEMELQRLEAQAWKRGTDGFRMPLAFILGSGEVLGKYVITEIGREYVKFFPGPIRPALRSGVEAAGPMPDESGKILEVTVTVALREFV